jgi:hypothetical protein
MRLNPFRAISVKVDNFISYVLPTKETTKKTAIGVLNLIVWAKRTHKIVHLKKLEKSSAAQKVTKISLPWKKWI